MKIAVVCLATGEYWRGAKVLFHTLEREGRLVDGVDRIVLRNEPCDFARSISIDRDYSWIPVSMKNFPRVADKFFALTLGYDRVILIDADVMCTGDCSLLWSGSLGPLAFYACRDTASQVYYGPIIKQIGLDPASLFNGGVMVFQEVDGDDVLSRIASGELIAYDGGDQGYLNCYFQKVRLGCNGWLSPKYNCCLDVNMPQVLPQNRRLIHFCGGNANPWDRHDMNPDDWRMPCYQLWDAAWTECDR